MYDRKYNFLLFSLKTHCCRLHWPHFQPTSLSTAQFSPHTFQRLNYGNNVASCKTSCGLFPPVATNCQLQAHGTVRICVCMCECTVGVSIKPHCPQLQTDCWYLVHATFCWSLAELLSCWVVWQLGSWR